MDPSEEIAKEHLLFRSFSEIVYEPDGNIPPDFLVEGRIACEVRRLNQNDFSAAPHMGLENSEISLTKHLARILASYGTSNVTRFLDVNFRRPLPKLPVLEKEARNFLDKVAIGALPEGTICTVGLNVELTYLCSIVDSGQTFELNDVNDPDWGGWILEVFDKNLRLCIDEKTRKIASYRSKYPEWWLILIDRVTYGLSDHNWSQFRQSARIDHDWDKVIIVNHIDPTHYFEL
jgi:hypothetical protein